VSEEIPVNWKLIFGLSLFGLAMGLATVFWVQSNVEPLFWLVIFVICALLTARQLSSRHFIHGLLVGIVNSVWVTAAHIAWFDRYMANHPREAAMAQSMPLSNSPRLMMALVGPMIGIISGVILGVFCLVAARFVKPRPRS